MILRIVNAPTHVLASGQKVAMSMPVPGSQRAIDVCYPIAIWLNAGKEGKEGEEGEDERFAIPFVPFFARAQLHKVSLYIQVKKRSPSAWYS